MLELYLGGFLLLWGGLMSMLAVKQYTNQQQMAGTATTRAADVTSGPVQIQGRAEAITPVVDPMYADDAVLVDWDLLKHLGGSKKDDRLLSGREREVFEVSDGSGSVSVDPTGADIEVTADGQRTESFQADDPEIGALRDRVDAHEGTGSEADRFYDRRIIRPGEEVTVFGTATETDDGPVVGMEPADKTSVTVGGGEPFVISTAGAPSTSSSSYGVKMIAMGGLSALTAAAGAYILFVGL